MLGYAIRKKKSSVLRSMKETFVERAAERGVAAADHRRGVQGLRAVRALRVQQGPRHLLRADRVPDRVPQGELHGRLHDVRAVRVPRQRREGGGRHRGVPAPGHRGADARRPPVAASGFTVEDDAIRFGLLAVKNVGEGAIESIIKAREEGGEFRSLTDFCTRVDLRLANRKVLESLAKVGALNCFGHPAQILLGLDDALAAGQAAQRDRISGQTSLFDMGGDEAATLERPLPSTPETPVRERLRWEKELMGLYLSDHPMGEVAERVGQFVTAYSGDLKDESLDGQRVVLGGIVTGIRSVMTKAKATMAVVTLEDLQGTLEVVVFPKTYETDDGDVARRRDPAGGRARGPPGRRGVAARRLGVGLGRGRGARAGGVRARGGVAGQAGRGAGRAGGPGGGGNGGGQAPAAAAAGTAGRANGGYARRAAAGHAGTRRPSPRRARPDLRRAARPRVRRRCRRRRERRGAAAPRGGQRARASRPPRPRHGPSRRHPGAVLNVRFAREAGTDRVVSAMQAFKSRAPRAAGGDARRRPRPGAGRRRAPDGAAGRRLRRGARRRGAPPRRATASSTSSLG